jgi:hypothetical protein
LSPNARTPVYTSTGFGKRQRSLRRGAVCSGVAPGARGDCDSSGQSLQANGGGGKPVDTAVYRFLSASTGFAATSTGLRSCLRVSTSVCLVAAAGCARRSETRRRVDGMGPPASSRRRARDRGWLGASTCGRRRSISRAVISAAGTRGPTSRAPRRTFRLHGRLDSGRLGCTARTVNQSEKLCGGHDRNAAV